jgi:hypothetical protein
MSLIWFDAEHGGKVVIESAHISLVRDVVNKPGIVAVFLIGNEEPVLLRDSVEGVYSTAIAHEKKA